MFGLIILWLESFCSPSSSLWFFFLIYNQTSSFFPLLIGMFPTQFRCGALLCLRYCGTGAFLGFLGGAVAKPDLNLVANCCSQLLTCAQNWWPSVPRVPHWIPMTQTPLCEIIVQMSFRNCPVHRPLCLCDYMFAPLLCGLLACVSTARRLDCVCTSVLCRSRVGAPLPRESGNGSWHLQPRVE